MQMDKIDIKIMKEFLTDFIMPPRKAHIRRSFRSLAKSIKIDQHAIRNRIRRLQEQGVIRRWYIAVNPAIFGLKTANLQIFLLDNSDKDEIMQKISSSFPNMGFLCNHLEPKLIVILYYRDAKDLDQDIDKLMKMTKATCVNKMPKLFTEYEAKLTESDWKIIGSLQEDPWKSYQAISKELKISSKTVKRRVEALAKGAAVYLLADVNMRAVEGIIPADLLIFYENRSNINSAVKDKTRLQIAEYLGDQLLFFDPNFAPDIDHFALILSSISKSQEIQKWAGRREGVKQSDISILLDVFPRLKLYEELIEDMIGQQQQSTGYIEKYSSSSGFK
ncbi:MAG: AsnC family transcriptional regulator [Thermoproteota archaeon]|nr:AsnC family transcriptional regulator [Thermoproteota archaeon]